MIDTRTLNRNANLVGLVSRRVRLKKVGKDWVGLCPFHSDKSPSFNVIPSKFMYYCHGCGATGDAIAWLQETEGLTFIQACEQLGATFDEEGYEIRKVKFPEPDREPITNWGGQGEMVGHKTILIWDSEKQPTEVRKMIREKDNFDPIWWPELSSVPAQMYLAPLIGHRLIHDNPNDWRAAPLAELIKTWKKHRKNIQDRNKL